MDAAKIVSKECPLIVLRQWRFSSPPLALPTGVVSTMSSWATGAMMGVPGAAWARDHCIFQPFVAGFYLSYLFRTINALIADKLASDLALAAADLGLLTSVYFLTFAAIQLPLGVWLDRYGPRQVQSILLVLAALGTALFGLAERLIPLVLGRALMGLGAAGSMMAGLKAIALWFPKERVALVNGWFVTVGALGAVTATIPAEWLLPLIGWRGMFLVLAPATALCAVAIYFVVPESRTGRGAPVAAGPIGLRAIYSDSRFWRLAPLSATCVGTSWALPGLWAASWLTDVEGLERGVVVRYLFVMAVALCVAGSGLGIAADRLRRRGICAPTLLVCIAVLFIAAQLALVLRWPLPFLSPLVDHCGHWGSNGSQLCDVGGVLPGGGDRPCQWRAEHLPFWIRLHCAVGDRSDRSAMDGPRRTLSCDCLPGCACA
jgi:MFS family permease